MRNSQSLIFSSKSDDAGVREGRFVRLLWGICIFGLRLAGVMMPGRSTVAFRSVGAWGSCNWTFRSLGPGSRCPNSMTGIPNALLRGERPYRNTRGTLS